MNELVVAAERCEECNTPLQPDWIRCPHCDVPAVVQTSPMTAAPPRAMVQAAGPADSWLDNRWIVTGLLLTVGPMGLPALWFSRRFSRPTKIAVTVVFFLLTAGLPLAVVWYFCGIALQPLVDAMSAANSMP